MRHRDAGRFLYPNIHLWCTYLHPHEQYIFRVSLSCALDYNFNFKPKQLHVISFICSSALIRFRGSSDNNALMLQCLLNVCGFCQPAPHGLSARTGWNQPQTPISSKSALASAKMMSYQTFLAQRNSSCGKAPGIPSSFLSAARDGAPAPASGLHKDAAAVRFIHWRPPLAQTRNVS